MHPRTSEHNMEVQVDHECHYFCCTTEKHPNGMSRFCLDEQQLPSYDDFYTKPKNSNPLDKEFDGFQKLLKTGLTEEQALKNSGSKPNGFLLDWKTTTTLNLSGNRNRCQHFRIFYGGITTRMFFLPLMLCRKKLSFIRTKG